MAIKVGESLPLDVKLKEMGESGPRDVSVGDIFRGKRVVLFAVPGAFTPTCSMKHLPGFVAQVEKIRAKGVDDVVCVAVNDAFVMDAWGKSSGATGKVRMLGDGNGDFTRAVGLELDATGFGKGLGMIIPRTLVGVWEFVSAPFPLPAGYEPILSPEFPWSYFESGRTETPMTPKRSKRHP